MSHATLSRFRALLVAGLMLAVMLGATFAVLGQGTAASPLQRNPIQSTIDGKVPTNLLAAGSEAYIRGDVNTVINIMYGCVRAANTFDRGLSGTCAVGTATDATTRFVTAFYTLDGSAPTTASKQFNMTTNAPQAVITNPSQLAFLATKDFRTPPLVNGQTLNMFIRVPITPTSDNPRACAGGTPGQPQVCFDTLDASGQPFYSLKFDTAAPRLFVSDPLNANVYSTSPTSWWLYTNKNMSDRRPVLEITVVDDELGSAIDQAAVVIYRAGVANTTRFEKSPSPTGRSVTYTYNYAATGVLSFEDNTTTRIDLVFADKVGHRVDTRPATNPGLWVITDITPPTLDNESSFLRRAGQATGLAALGEKLSVAVFANDTAVTLSTPERHLTATAQLATGPGHTMRSPTFALAYNKTSDRYVSSNVTVPSTWASGQTVAYVTITDGALNSVTKLINGTVSVDIDKPTITPVAPIGTDKAESFLNRATVDFRVRVVDTDDGDTWAGAQTIDTDNIGVDLNSVRLFFKVGASGAVSSVRLGALTAENTFGGTRTFNPEDEVFYYFQAKDLAGNTVRYPASADPHLEHTNTTFNNGLFLRLQIDQVGPSIKEARALAYVGQGPHTFPFIITDSGIGLDKTSPTFLWRIKGETNYRELALTEATIKVRNATGVLKDTLVYQATVPTQAEGAIIEWHVSAKDKLENPATFGSAGGPRSSIVDVTPPTVTVTAPATTKEARFNITWTGTDAGAGVQDYTLQFRAAGGPWFTVPTRDRTILTTFSVCAATGNTYDFRVSARDNAGNERTFPNTPDASTVVDAATSCAQKPDVSITSPGAGETVSGKVQVLYTAASTSFPNALKVGIQAGQVTSLATLANDLANTGTFEWDTSAPLAESVCIVDGALTLRVTAVDPNGLEGQANVIGLVLNNGITNCNDRDNDGLADQWEFLNFGDLSQDGDGDPDGDGFTNRQEFAASTNPNSAASRPGGNNPGGSGDDGTGWDNLYLIVVFAFAAVLGTFAVGMTRRW